MCFYSSPSCDGDPERQVSGIISKVSILPRLATGILSGDQAHRHYQFLFFPVLRRGSPTDDGNHAPVVSILPRLATGIEKTEALDEIIEFLFFPVLRRGSFWLDGSDTEGTVSILPRLATGIYTNRRAAFWRSFYSSPSCDGDHGSDVSTFHDRGFYSSPSCDGDRERTVT